MSGLLQTLYRLPPTLVVVAAAMSVSCRDSVPAPDAETPPTPQTEAEAIEPTAKLAVDDSVLADEGLTSAWPAYGGTHYERRFSPLADINAENVGGLRVDWYLDLSSNAISRVAFLESLGQLEHLYLADNRITDITPVAALSAIRELDLSGNELTDISPLTSLENLRRIKLDGNPLADISPLLSFGELEHVSLTDVPAPPCPTIDMLILEMGDDAVEWEGVCR